MYQETTLTIATTEHRLKQQCNIKSHKSIPKQYRPQLLEIISPANNDLDINFSKEYNKLFFKYLDSVITANTVTLEITKAKRHSIISETETFLAKYCPLQNITSKYNTFLKNNEIRNHQPCSILKDHLSTHDTTCQQKQLPRDTQTLSTDVKKHLTSDTSTTLPTTSHNKSNRKRPNSKEHTHAQKQLKLAPFLDKGSKYQHHKT